MGPYQHNRGAVALAPYLFFYFPIFSDALLRVKKNCFFFQIMGP